MEIEGSSTSALEPLSRSGRWQDNALASWAGIDVSGRLAEERRYRPIYMETETETEGFPLPPLASRASMNHWASADLSA